MNARAAQKCPAAARSPLWALLATLEKYLAASAYWRLRKAERPATQLAIADHSPPSPAAFCASTSARRSSPALYQAQAIRWVHCVRLSLSSEVRSRRSAASATRLAIKRGRTCAAKAAVAASARAGRGFSRPAPPKIGRAHV